MGFKWRIDGAMALVLVAWGPSAGASDLRLPRTGRVTLEFLDARDEDPSTLSVVSPAVGVTASGCRAEPAQGLPGRPLVTGRASERGCRVILDADPDTPGAQPFPAGTPFSFRLCVQAHPSAACERVWSSNSGQVKRTAISDGAFRYNWEHDPVGPHSDFNDHIVVLRIDGDRDGDGLWDDWEEASGIDTDGDGHVDLPLPEADPDHKDVYVELDWMDCRVAGSDCQTLPDPTPHDHRPGDAGIEQARAVYAAAPVENPDGRPGIRLHVQRGDPIAHQRFLDLGCFQGHSFADVKARNFRPPRRFAYHYGVFGHNQAPEDRGNAGCAEVGGNDFLVTLADWTRFWPADRLHAGSLLHELGHNLGLRHGGGDNIDLKPNYLSVMNHRYQYRGIPPHGDLDYSRRPLPTLDETNLSERQSLPEAVLYGCPRPNSDIVCISAPGQPIDWNCKDGIEDGTLRLDLNRDRFCIRPRGDGDLQTCREPAPRCAVNDETETVRQFLPEGGEASVDWYQDGPDRRCALRADPADQQLRPVGHRQPRRLRGFSDWDKLAYAFQADLGHGNGSEISVQEEVEGDLDEELIILTFETVPAGMVRPGATLTYFITVQNQSTLIDDGVFEQRLPRGTAFVSCRPRNRCTPGSEMVHFDLPPLQNGEQARLEVTVRVPADTPEGTRLRSTARVASRPLTPDVKCLPGELFISPSSRDRAALSVTVSSRAARETTP